VRSFLNLQPLISAVLGFDLLAFLGNRPPEELPGSIFGIRYAHQGRDGDNLFLKVRSGVNHSATRFTGPCLKPLKRECPPLHRAQQQAGRQIWTVPRTQCRGSS